LVNHRLQPLPFEKLHKLRDDDYDDVSSQGSVFAQSTKCTMGSGGGSSGGVVGAAMDAWTGMTARQRRKQWEAEEGNRLVSKNGLFEPFIYKNEHLDRLGTNIGKALKKGPCFLRSLRARAQRCRTASRSGRGIFRTATSL
jgi:hypothetical protein